jgi:hypothetical protein
VQVVETLLALHSFRYSTRVHTQTLALVGDLLVAALHAHASTLGRSGTELLVDSTCAVLDSSVLRRALADLEDDWTSGTVFGGNWITQSAEGTTVKGLPKDMALQVVQIIYGFLMRHVKVCH